MPWVKIDDHFNEHPKLAKVGPLGIAVWVAGLAYCNRNLTDGFIPRSTALTLAVWEYEDEYGEVWDITITNTADTMTEKMDAYRIIAILCNAGLWEQTTGGYQIHDYDQFQPTKAEVEAERDAKRRAGQAGGQASAKARAKPTAKAPALIEAKQTASSRSTQLQAESNPVPVPVPDTEPKRNEGGSASHEAAAAAAPLPPSAIALEVAETLITAPWVNDELVDVAREVDRLFGKVPDYNVRDGPAMAELYANWRGYRRKPPENWSMAWLKWLRKEVGDATRTEANATGGGNNRPGKYADAAAEQPITPAYRPRVPRAAV